MVELAETLTRKIGPFPVWGYGVGIGGGILVAQMLRGRGSSTPASDTATDTTQTEDVDTSTVTSQGQRGEKGEKGETGEAGKSAATAPTRPTNNPEGWTPQYDPSSNTWKYIYTPKPTTAPSGKKWAWASGTGTWHLVDDTNSTPTQTTVVRDAGAKGPIISAGSNSSPTIHMGDVGGYTIASPDGTPRPRTTTIRPNPIGMVPMIAGQKPRSLSRQMGRPFYGV